MIYQAHNFMRYVNICVKTILIMMTYLMMIKSFKNYI